MEKKDQAQKGYNEKNPAQQQGSIVPDNSNEERKHPANASPNEKLSIPERKLRKEKK